MKKNSHGANLFELSQKYKFKPEDIKDYSSNINPFGTSRKALDYVRAHLENISIYPDPEYRTLREAIASYSKSDPDDILLGEGATGLISGFINAVSPKRALIVMPSYSEYETQIKKTSDCEIIHYVLSKDRGFKGSVEEIMQLSLEEEVDLLILCNPNNPTGSCFSYSEIETLAQNIPSKILIDETYVEFTNTEVFSSCALTKKYRNLFVIRGTSKFFSTPGLRLGYALCSDPDVRAYFETHTDLWNINIIATMMGEHMFTDKEYIEDTFRKITAEREFLLENLRCFEELKVYDSYGNFILCEIISKRIDASQVYDTLIKDALAIRNCTSFSYLSPYFFRVCTLLPKENRLLIEKLSEVLR